MCLGFGLALEPFGTCEAGTGRDKKPVGASAAKERSSPTEREIRLRLGVVSAVEGKCTVGSEPKENAPLALSRREMHLRLSAFSFRGPEKAAVR